MNIVSEGRFLASPEFVRCVLCGACIGKNTFSRFFTFWRETSHQNSVLHCFSPLCSGMDVVALDTREMIHDNDKPRSSTILNISS